jgi:pimeloyl-ACP methyl ester carboxylesterase
MPVVLLTPVGLDPRCWAWAGIANPQTFAYPGHGNRPFAPFTLESLADEVVETFGGDLTLVGASMGGMLAQRIALRHPDRVRSAVFACTSAAPDPDVLRARAAAARAHGMAPLVEETLARWFSPDFLAAEPAPPPVDYVRTALREIDPEAFAAGWDAMARHAVLDDLAAIRVPVTCLAAADDASSSWEGMVELDRRLPDSQLVRVAGPHMVMLERPEAFRAAVLAHLERVAERDPRSPSPSNQPGK